MWSTDARIHGVVTVLDFKSVTAHYMFFSTAACREDGGWPQTAAGCIFAIPCLKDYKGTTSCCAHVLMAATCEHWSIHAGNITRRCGEDGVWQNPDNSTCENIAFINFRNEVCSYVQLVPFWPTVTRLYTHRLKNFLRLKPMMKILFEFWT